MDSHETIHVHALIASLTWGGAEMLLSDFAAGAPAAGIDLSVGYLVDVDGSPAAARLRANGVEPILAEVQSAHPMLSPSDHRMVRRHIAKVSPDVVHTHLGYADMFGGLAARALGLAAVSTIHTMDWRRNLLDPRGYAKERVMSAVRRRFVSTVVTVSDAARDAYLQTGWDEPEHVLTVHNGIVARLKRGAGAAVRSELAIQPEDLVVAMITVLRPGKGHDVAVRAVERLRGRFPRLKLLIVGEGPSRREVERLAASLGDSAVLTGHREDVLALLDAADVLLHPTLVDAFPTVLLEAMAAEVPIIATAVGGIPEIVAPERTGLLVEAPPTVEKLVRALTSLLDSASMRRELGEQGRRRFDAHFTAEAWAKRMRAVYDGALRSVGVPNARARPRSITSPE